RLIGSHEHTAGGDYVGMLTGEPEVAVARREDNRDSGCDRCRNGCGQRLVGGAQRPELNAASPTAGDYVWAQADRRLECSGRVSEVHLDRHEANIRRDRKNIRRFSGPVANFVIQGVGRAGTQNYRCDVVSSTDEVRMLEVTAVAHRDLDSPAGNAGA